MAGPETLLEMPTTSSGASSSDEQDTLPSAKSNWCTPLRAHFRFDKMFVILFMSDRASLRPNMAHTVPLQPDIVGGLLGGCGTEAWARKLS